MFIVIAIIYFANNNLDAGIGIILSNKKVVFLKVSIVLFVPYKKEANAEIIKIIENATVNDPPNVLSIAS